MCWPSSYQWEHLASFVWPSHLKERKTLYGLSLYYIKKCFSKVVRNCDSSTNPRRVETRHTTDFRVYKCKPNHSRLSYLLKLHIKLQRNANAILALFHLCIILCNGVYIHSAVWVSLSRWRIGPQIKADSSLTLAKTRNWWKNQVLKKVIEGI